MRLDRQMCRGRELERCEGWKPRSAAASRGLASYACLAGLEEPDSREKQRPFEMYHPMSVIGLGRTAKCVLLIVRSYGGADNLPVDLP